MERFMHPYVLSCGSTADLTREQFERRDISYICYPFELDGKAYRDDLGQTMPYAVLRRHDCRSGDENGTDQRL